MSTSKGKTTRDAGSIRPVPLAEQRRRPTHPGDIFREDYRLAQAPPVSQAEAARRMGWSVVRLNEFENGKRGVSAVNAIGLAALTGTSPEFWMALQAAVDLWDAYQALPPAKRRLQGAAFAADTRGDRS